jgi:hypothetical protein
MGWLAFTLCKWFIGGARLEECKELKWATLTKHWGMLEIYSQISCHGGYTSVSEKPIKD